RLPAAEAHDQRVRRARPRRRFVSRVGAVDSRIPRPALGARRDVVLGGVRSERRGADDVRPRARDQLTTIRTHQRDGDASGMSREWRSPRVHGRMEPEAAGMRRGFIIRLLVNAAALWVATRIVTGVEYDGGWLPFLGVALIFGVV